MNTVGRPQSEARKTPEQSLDHRRTPDGPWRHHLFLESCPMPNTLDDVRCYREREVAKLLGVRAYVQSLANSSADAA
jgi:hypothetical protein